MKNSQRGFIAPLLLVIIAAFLVGGGYLYIHNQQTVNNVATKPLTQSELYEKLIVKARQSGHVRIVVGVQDSYKPTTGPNAKAEDEAHRVIVAQLINNLLLKLKGYDAVVTRRLNDFAMIGLIVDARALEALRSWPEINGIEEDSPIPFLD